MPAFELLDIDTRKPVRSQDLLGTPYLLELWSTWCKPCIEEMKALHELHAELEAEGGRMRMISVAVNEGCDPVRSFRAERWPMPWTNVWAPGGAPLFEAWSLTSVPYVVLVDAQGKVLRAGPHLSLDEVRAAAR